MVLFRGWEEAGLYVAPHHILEACCIDTSHYCPFHCKIHSLAISPPHCSTILFPVPPPFLLHHSPLLPSWACCFYCNGIPSTLPRSCFPLSFLLQRYPAFILPPPPLLLKRLPLPPPTFVARCFDYNSLSTHPRASSSLGLPAVFLQHSQPTLVLATLTPPAFVRPLLSLQHTVNPPSCLLVPLTIFIATFLVRFYCDTSPTT
jgi:hypothetical protein